MMDTNTRSMRDGSLEAARAIKWAERERAVDVIILTHKEWEEVQVSETKPSFPSTAALYGIAAEKYPTRAEVERRATELRKEGKRVMTTVGEG